MQMEIALIGVSVYNVCNKVTNSVANFKCVRVFCCHFVLFYFINVDSVTFMQSYWLNQFLKWDSKYNIIADNIHFVPPIHRIRQRRNNFAFYIENKKMKKKTFEKRENERKYELSSLVQVHTFNVHLNFIQSTKLNNRITNYDAIIVQ